MTHQFTVGEYKTKGGNNVVVLEVGPHDQLFGREQFTSNGLWYANRWRSNGEHVSDASSRQGDLVPPIRIIWMYSWINKSGVTRTEWTINKECAERAVTYNGRTKIAVTGPHEVPQ